MYYLLTTKVYKVTKTAQAKYEPRWSMHKEFSLSGPFEETRVAEKAASRFLGTMGALGAQVCTLAWLKTQLGFGGVLEQASNSLKTQINKMDN